MSTMPQNCSSSAGSTAAATGRHGGREGGKPNGIAGRSGDAGHPSTVMSQQELEGEGGITTGVEDPTHRSVDDQAKDLDEMSSSGKTRRQPGTLSGGGVGGGGSLRGERKPVEGQGGVGRGAKGRWVTTMMVPGRKLWDSSPAMMSQYKRFRRSRQDPKIARDQVCE